MDWHRPETRCWKRCDSQTAFEYRYSLKPSPYSLSGQLLAVCQQIHIKSSNVLYGENTFGLHIYIYLDRGDDKGSSLIETSFFEGFDIDQLDPP